MSRTNSYSLEGPRARGILGALAFVVVIAVGFSGQRVRADEPRANQAVAAAGPQNVGPDELAGMVVDAQGKPLEGVEVDAWTWYPGNETRTDARGWFRLKKLDSHRKVEVVFRKQGFTPELFVTQPAGSPNWVVVLGNRTFFEGTVTRPGGKPVASALIRANQGPKRADGVIITEIWTETRTDAEGHYRLYAQADVYDIQVRVPGVGAAVGGQPHRQAGSRSPSLELAA